jgi:hypothetical protein
MASKKKHATADAEDDTAQSAAERTRANILKVATHEFSERGLAGARVDEIAERTNTSKRMIYYYFESKEGLYRAVLEKAYEQIRRIEGDVTTDQLPPVEALRQLVGATYDWHNDHPDFVRLVMNENIHRAQHIGTLDILLTRRRSILDLLQKLLQRGEKSGDFRKGLDPLDLHMTISALSFYNVSNRHTFSRIFEHDMSAAKVLRARREVVIDTVLRWCRAEAVTGPRRGN